MVFQNNKLIFILFILINIFKTKKVYFSIKNIYFDQKKNFNIYFQ